MKMNVVEYSHLELLFIPDTKKLMVPTIFSSTSGESWSSSLISPTKKL